MPGLGLLKISECLTKRKVLQYVSGKGEGAHFNLQSSHKIEYNNIIKVNFRGETMHLTPEGTVVHNDL